MKIFLISFESKKVGVTEGVTNKKREKLQKLEVSIS